ncbi:MAG: biotin/lipoate A/B protein ligase family protein [Planctomycetaceae bacterium]
MPSVEFNSLIIEPEPLPGSRNMAVDEALLEAAVNDGRCAVRVYRWCEPTVSLGYFQRHEDVEADSPLAGLAVVRRFTGGGAILHHHEWTYSCALPAGHPAAAVPYDLYATVHRAIMNVLRDRGVSAQSRSDDTRTDLRGLTPSGSPFLCFSRRDPNDVVLNGRKIVGSAQRRRKGAVLQHGSILVRASKHAPHLPGIADLVSGFRDDSLLGEHLGTAIAESLTGERRAPAR